MVVRENKVLWMCLQDYYGVTFPGTAATMPGRDGLANNPYSGEIAFFIIQ